MGLEQLPERILQENWRWCPIPSPPPLPDKNENFENVKNES